MKDLIKNDELADVLKKLEESFFDIPFGNSTFQVEKFIINEAQTPERAFRAVGLGLYGAITTLKEAQYNQEKRQIDKDELEWKIDKLKNSSEPGDKFELRRLELDLKRFHSDDGYANKLLNDSITEFKTYLNIYNQFQDLLGENMTREQFEAGEEVHFQRKLVRQVIGQEGSLGSLIDMGFGIKQHANGIELESIKELQEYMPPLKQLANGIARTDALLDHLKKLSLGYDKKQE